MTYGCGHPGDHRLWIERHPVSEMFDALRDDVKCKIKVLEQKEKEIKVELAELEIQEAVLIKQLRNSTHS